MGVGVVLVCPALHAQVPPEAEVPVDVTAATVAEVPAQAAAEVPAAGVAAPSAERAADNYDLTARSETYLELFEQALLPGPSGELIVTETLAPVHEYLFFRGDRLDAPWADDALAFELQAWGTATFIGDELARNPDGDVPVANVAARFGDARVRLGRQVETLGAARFTRFDGAEATVRTESGIMAAGYGGLTVSPRWSARPAYYQLGSAADTLLDSPAALPEASRSGDWVAGAVVGYSHDAILGADLGFHEERDGGALERRELAANVHLVPVKPVDVAAEAFLDLDAFAISEATLALDWYATSALALMGEVRHVTPQLLLGKQSVLSVFRTSAFDELGAEARYRVSSRLSLRAAQYGTALGLGDIGARTRLGLRAQPALDGRLTLDVEYRRVIEPDNGYHSTRLAARYAVAAPITVTGEHDAYFYDRSIGSVDFSSVEALTLEVAPAKRLRVLLGASLAQTPYALADAQGVLRVAYQLDHEDSP